MSILVKLDDVINEIKSLDHGGCIIRSTNHVCENIRMEVPTVEAIPKADYEARLKADMVAMLTEIQMEIREYHEIGCDEDCNNCCMVGCIEPVNVIKDLDIIQQKIDKLKEVEQ